MTNRTKGDEDASENPLASMEGVVPIPGPRRVAPSVPEKAPARGLPVAGEGEGRPAFVVSSEEGFTAGYRQELGPSVLHAVRGRHFQPQHVLDLHGYRTAELEAEVYRVVREAASRGLSRLLLVHGKGLHSAGGVGLLLPALVDALTEGRAAPHVRAFATASARLGGSGALAVELVRRSRAPRTR